MKLRKLTQVLILAGGMTSFAAGLVSAEEFGVEMRGPGGVKKPAPAATDGVRRASSTVVDGSSRKGTGKKRDAASSKKDDAPKFKDPDKICKLKTIPDIAVPEAKIPVIPEAELMKPRELHAVKRGESFASLIQYAQNDDQSLNTDQIYAAILRLNPKSFRGTGPLADARIQIPGEALIRLENPESGKKVRESLNKGLVEKVKLPDLELPWTKEQNEIAAIAAQKQKRDQEQDRLNKEYETCRNHVIAENNRIREAEEDRKRAAVETADISSPDMMIQDDPGQNISDDGKRHITLVDENKKSESGSGVSGTSVSGSTLTLTSGSAVGKNSQGNAVSGGASSEELKKLQFRVDELAEHLGRERSDSELRIQTLREEVEALKFNQEVLMKRLEALEKNTSEVSGKSSDDNGMMIFVFMLMGVILLSGIGFGAYLRIKQNRKRKAMLFDEDDNIMEGTDDLNVLDSLGGDNIDDISGSRQKEVSLNPPPQPKPQPEPQPAPHPAGDLNDLDEESFRQSIKVPDLEKPDEGIPEASSSPDLVPPRPSSRHEQPKPEPAPAPEPDPKEQEEAARAMGIDLSMDGEAQDAAMDEWAKALGEQKESEKNSGTNGGAPASDADVMNEWAAALGEQKKEEQKGTEPKSDADVMNEWAAALGEQKEEEQKGADQKPKSDADVMDEWAAALGEQKKEEQKGTEPKSDADVMDEWAKALGEQKEEEQKPKSDDEVLDEWARALNEQKNS